MPTDAVDRLNAALEGRYRVERELGEGGMAKVYLAHDEKHNRSVALKVLKPELAAVVGAERFLAEIETTANLQHPHILPLFDSGEADGFLFYVMPYVEGETLRDRIDRDKQLPIDEALGIATAIANALDAAHELGVVHRDIKPGNILLSRGEPLVSDFGIALAVGAGGGSRLTETGLSVGTPYYMSPEQATGDRVVGASTDIYALGCVLYEMLVGEPPYLGNTAQAVLGKIIQGQPVSATAARATIPPNVDAAIRKSLEKLPADRFTRAHDFARALADKGFRYGSDAELGSAASQKWKKVALATSALAVVFAITTAIGLRPVSEAPLPVQRFAQPFRAGQEPGDQAELSSDGSFVVYDRGTQDDRQLWLRRWDDLDATPIRGTEGEQSFALSPEGTEVAVGFADGVRVVPIAGGPARALLDEGQMSVWGDDGWVYATESNTKIVRVRPSGGAVEDVYQLPEGDDRVFAAVLDVIPGGAALLLGTVRVVGSEFQVETSILDLPGGEPRFLVEGFAEYLPSGQIAFGTTDNDLLVSAFDAKSLELTGSPVVMARGVNYFSVSESGSLIYRVGAVTTAVVPKYELVWVSRSGEVSPVDPSWTFDPATPNTGWSISPDGTRVALKTATDGNADIWVKELDRGPLSRLTRDESEQRAPRWSPDGTMITYLSATGEGDYDVWQRRADGTGEPELVYDSDGLLAQGFWGPDGEWLILRTSTGNQADSRREIVALRPDVDTLPTVALEGDYNEVAPALSPDGRWLAYGSDETGAYEVFVRPFPEVDSGKWQVSVGGGLAPLWSPASDELFYRDGQGTTLMAARYAVEGDRFRVVDRSSLFELPDDIYGSDATSFITGLYDVTPDGQRFLFARRVADEGAGAGPEQGADPDDGKFVLVVNWLEEVKARLGGGR